MNRTLTRITRLAAAAAVLAAPLAAALATTTPSYAAGDEIAWAVRTASNDFGDERQNYSYTVEPGGSVEDGLVVVNHGTEPLDLAVYAADGFTTEAGQLDLDTADKDPRGVGAWVRPGQESVRLDPEQEVTVPFTLTVPENATPGDHVGGIITSLSQPGAEPGITVDRRLAVRIRLRVGGALAPSFAVEGLKVDYAGTANPVGSGDATVEYTVHNTGNAIATSRQDVSLEGPFGLFEAEVPDVADTPELLPGESWTVRVPVAGVTPAMRLTAHVAVTPVVTDASGSTSPLAVIEASGHAWALPWTLLAALLVVVVLVVVRLVRVRRRRSGAQAREDARVQAAVDQALRDRATTDA
jgi:hypothetical protein